MAPSPTATQAIAPPAPAYTIDKLRELPPRPRTLVWSLRNPAKNSQAIENISVRVETNDYEELQISIISNDVSLPFLWDVIQSELGSQWQIMGAHYPKCSGGLN